LGISIKNLSTTVIKTVKNIFCFHAKIKGEPHMITKVHKSIWMIVQTLVLSVGFLLSVTPFQANAVTGVPEILNFQGRLLDSSGNLLGSAGGTEYCYKFSIYDDPTVGTKLWPSGAPTGQSITTRLGVFDAYVGSADTLDYNFNDNDTTYMNVEVATKVGGSCTNGDESYESLSPRPQIVSSAYALNSGRVEGFAPSTSTTLTLSATNPIITATGANGLTLDSGAAGSVIVGSTAGTLTLCSSTGCDTINIGTNADADLITIGDVTNDTLSLNGSTVEINSGDWSISTTGAITGVSFDANGSGNSISNIESADILDGTLDADDLDYATEDGAPADGECLKFETSGGGDFLWGACGAGGGSTLQDSYGLDVDGSDVTISLTSADDSLIFTNPTSSGTDSAFLVQFNQANTTDDVVGLDIIQASNAANAVNLTANAIDTETGLALTANALTSGSGMTLASSATAFTGSLASFSLTGSNASNTGNIVLIDNTGTNSASTGLRINHYATGTGNLALRIDDVSGDTTPLIVDGDGRLGVGTSSIEGTTERLLQVGSPTQRGNSATYGDVVTKGLTDFTTLANIQDTYLYDTTADSDGGRWIDWATTDQLSWYSEAVDDGPSDACNIATDDRCYSQSFPRKALLVVTTDALYIFDATNNVMWMKFSQNASGYALGANTNNDPTSVTAKNGVIYVGARGSASGGLYAFDFVNDRMWNYNATHRASSDVGIGSRNGAVTYASDVNVKLQLDPVGTSAEWMNVNDVDVQVIRGSNTAITIGGAANISPQNGKTFVALATDSGMTLIDVSAQVLLQYSDVTADDYTAVALSTQGDLYGLNTTSDQLERWDNVDSDKVSEVNGTFTVKFDETQATSPQISPSTPNMILGAPDALEIIPKASLSQLTAANANGDLIYVGHSLGLAEIHDNSTTLAGWSKFFNTTRQVGLMSGYVDMYLPLDDTSGTQAQDWGVANTDMAIKGSPALAQTGVRNKSILFDNTDDYLCSDANQDNTCDLDTIFNVTTVGWTLELWFRHSTTLPATPDMIFEKCVTAVPAQATGCVAAYMTTTGTIGVGIDDDATWTRGSSYDITATSSLAYNDDKWHHLVLSRTNANDLDVYIDGNPLNLSNATGLTTTIDGSQIVTFGAGCVTTVTANCGAADNFWDGYIDDINFMVATTTLATLTPAQVRYRYNDARPLVNKRVINVDNATSATSTTITDTGESWIPNEFTGLLVTLTGGTGSGQTRRIVGNTTDTLTVSPAWSTTPDTTTDFEVDPEALYGSSNQVYAIGITGEAPLGEARQMCIGTNDGSDGGGITCYNHQAGPSIVADIYHSDTEQTDDYGDEWTGANYDDIRSIDISGRAMALANEAGFLTETSDVRLGQGLDYISNQLFNIRSEILNDGIFTTGSIGVEVGFVGGADLAEYYYSNVPLTAGDVVATEPLQTAGITKSSSKYQTNLLGVVSAAPALILGPIAENAYPIALAGRVPVKVTTENGLIKVGDELTSASMDGFAMKATKAGPVIGKVINEPISMVSCDASMPDISELLMSDGPGVTAEDAGIMPQEGFDLEGQPILEQITEATEEVNEDLQAVKDIDLTDGEYCGYAMVFVGISDSLGDNIVALAKAKAEQDDENGVGNNAMTIETIEGLDVFVLTAPGSTQEMIMDFLRSVKEGYDGEELELQSIYTDRIAAAVEILTPTLISDEIDVGDLRAGLSFFESEAQFGGRVVFNGPSEFVVPPIFNKDTAGFALINEGDTHVEIVFDQPYIVTPIVNVNMTFEALDNIDDISLETLFEEDYKYVVYNKDINGFTVILNKPALRNIRFSWVALGVKDPKIFESVFGGLVLDEPILEQDDQEEIPVSQDIPEFQIESNEEDESIPNMISSGEGLDSEVFPQEEVEASPDEETELLDSLQNQDLFSEGGFDIFEESIEIPDSLEVEEGDGVSGTETQEEAISSDLEINDGVVTGEF
jgi:hypothetical protein